jgi:hypothetical protein
MKPKLPKVNHDQRSELIWLNASMFRPKLTKDRKTLMLFLSQGGVVIGLNLAYLDAIRAAAKKKAA